MNEQEIRAKALEFAIKTIPLYTDADRFEATGENKGVEQLVIECAERYLAFINT